MRLSKGTTSGPPFDKPFDVAQESSQAERIGGTHFKGDRPLVGCDHT